MVNTKRWEWDAERIKRYLETYVGDISVGERPTNTVHSVIIRQKQRQQPFSHDIRIYFIDYKEYMIIRNFPQRTLKVSPLSNRSVRRTCGQIAIADSTLEECPNWAQMDDSFFEVSERPEVERLSGDASSVLYGFMRRIICFEYFHQSSTITLMRKHLKSVAAKEQSVLTVMRRLLRHTPGDLIYDR